MPELEALLTELLALIEEFEAIAAPEAATAFWNSKVIPLLGRIGAMSGLGGRVALEYAYRLLGVGISSLATDAELATLSAMLARKQRDSVIKKMMARAVASEWVPVAGQVITGVCLLAFARDIYKVSQIPGQMRDYQGYMGRYLGYLVRNSVVHEGKVRLPRPALPMEYAQRSNSGAWWQC